MVEIDVDVDPDDLVASLTAAVVVDVALADVIFDDSYIVVCVAVVDGDAVNSCLVHVDK